MSPCKAVLTKPPLKSKRSNWTTPFFMQGFGEIISLESVEILKRKKIILYRQIKELEMEYDIGNLESEDFKNRRAELKSEVSLIIDKIKKK